MIIQRDNPPVAAAIVFDLWETLGSKGFSVSRRLREQFGIQDRPGYLREYEEAVQLTAWTSMEEMSRGFLRAFSLPITKPSLDCVGQVFLDGIAQATVNAKAVDLVRELAASYPLGLLSNTTIFESSVIALWGLEEVFTACVYSWQIECLKPDVHAFRQICNSLRVQPEECLFVDDGQANIRAAEALGMRGYLFTDPEELRLSLRQDRVLR